MAQAPPKSDEARRIRATNRRKRQVVEEIALIVVLSSLVCVVGWFSGIFDWIIQYADPETGTGGFQGEIIGTLMFLSVAMMVFSYRRWQESREEARAQVEVSKKLTLLNQEMEVRVQQRTAELLKSNDALK